MMKKTKLFFLLLISTVFLHGQEYLPMLKENRVWSILHEKHTLIGDTLINDISYKKLYYHAYLEDLTPDSLKYIAALREDTLQQQIHFVWNGYEEEFLLYDFSLEVGSEFSINTPTFFGEYGSAGPDPFFSDEEWYKRTVEVSDIQTEEIAGASRRIVELTYFRTEWDYASFYWIEGIGAEVGGLTYSGVQPVFEYKKATDAETDRAILSGPMIASFYCLHEDGELIYHCHWYALSNWGHCVEEKCHFDNWGVNIEQISYDKFTLEAIPSIFNERVTIRSASPVHKIYITDSMGRVVFEKQTVEPFKEKTISTGHWPKGLYIVRAEGKNTNERAYLKIIKY